MSEMYEKLFDGKYEFSRVYLTNCFREDFAKHNTSFDFGKADWHWNAYGHRVVAECVMKHLEKGSTPIYVR